MSKRELIDAILQHNRTAAPEFLARFAESDLKAYLDRVCTISPVKSWQQISTTTSSQKQLVMA